MRASGTVVFALAALSALAARCQADARQEQQEHSPAERFDYGSTALSQDSPWRPAREARRVARLAWRYQRLSPLGSRHLVPDGFYDDPDGLLKRNFDEIDRSNLDTFARKRNFDEIEQSSMPFPFKRFYPLMGPNYLDMPLSSLDKKHYGPDYPMDEIDFSQFPIGSKRSPANVRTPLPR